MRGEKIEKKNLIVGVDPGKTVGVAILDTDGKVLENRSKRDWDINDLASFILKFGKPLIIATDKGYLPNFVKKLSSIFECKTFIPKKDLSLNEKFKLVGKGKDHHKLDALAAAKYAFKNYEGLIKKVKEVGEKLDKKDKIYDVERKIILGKIGNIKEGFKEEIKKEIKKKKREKKMNINIIEKLKRENEELKSVVIKLKEEIRKKEALLNYVGKKSFDLDKKTKELLKYKNELINKLNDKIKELEEQNIELKKEIKKLKKEMELIREGKIIVKDKPERGCLFIGVGDPFELKKKGVLGVVSEEEFFQEIPFIKIKIKEEDNIKYVEKEEFEKKKKEVKKKYLQSLIS